MDIDRILGRFKRNGYNVTRCASGKIMENASAFIRSLIDEAISKERSAGGEWFPLPYQRFINQALDNTVKSFNYEEFILLHKEERLSYH